MDKKQFNLISRIVGLAVFVVATLTYVLTLEPTTSFWDCGEFIASSYKLEVGHPPGNPVFQLVARFFTMFASAENAAYAVNFMNAICSSLTILFLYLTIMHLGRRLLEKNGREYLSVSNAIALWGSAAVGALAYCWSDTFWFSAVEGEVYAMSSLLTAIVFWAMLKWEDEADEPYANRWIVLIAFLLGLSIGVHLLNLLAIPAIAFIYYYKKSTSFTWGKAFGVLALSAVILAVILWGIIPYLPKLAAYVDLLFVNGFGLPYNTGAVVFMLLLLAACFWLIYFSHKRGKVLLNTITLCFTMIVIGYSSFAVVVIRSSVNTPTNEYQPDNPFTLVRYLGREQYGSNPLVYGETFASVPTSYSVPKYYTPLDGKYYKTDGPLDVKYPAESKMFFPRMWSKSPDHIEFYKHYTGDGKVPQGGSHKMPTFKENLSFFFDYQINWMYFRYFFWNFVGRQNDLHSPSPGEPLKGNWESGIQSSRGFYSFGLFYIDGFVAGCAVGVLPREMVASTEAAERHLAVLGLDCSLGLPFTVDEVIQGMVYCFRTHVSREDAADRRFSRSTAVINDIPPCDAVHLLDRKPCTIEIAGYDSLHHLATTGIVRCGNRNLGKMYWTIRLRQGFKDFPDTVGMRLSVRIWRKFASRNVHALRRVEKMHLRTDHVNAGTVVDKILDLIEERVHVVVVDVEPCRL